MGARCACLSQGRAAGRRSVPGVVQLRVHRAQRQHQRGGSARGVAAQRLSGRDQELAGRSGRRPGHLAPHRGPPGVPDGQSATAGGPEGAQTGHAPQGAAGACQGAHAIHRARCLSVAGTLPARRAGADRRLSPDSTPRRGTEHHRRAERSWWLRWRPAAAAHRSSAGTGGRARHGAGRNPAIATAAACCRLRTAQPAPGNRRLAGLGGGTHLRTVVETPHPRVPSLSRVIRIRASRPDQRSEA